MSLLYVVTRTFLTDRDDVNLADTVTADALLELGWAVTFDPDLEGGTLQARWWENMLEARPVPHEPARSGVIAWVDEASHYAETGELFRKGDAIPLEAVTLTEIELELFHPHSLDGTVIAIKGQYYRMGRDDTRRKVLAELGDWQPTGARQGGKSLLQDLAARVAAACGQDVEVVGREPAEEFGRHRHTCAKLRDHSAACDCGGYR